jgi:hypothetical protein
MPGCAKSARYTARTQVAHCPEIGQVPPAIAWPTAAREARCNLLMIRDTCVSTVFSLITSWAAICRLVVPARLPGGLVRVAVGAQLGGPVILNGAAVAALREEVPAGDEHEVVLARRVEPLHVVGHGQHGLPGGQVDQQVQRGEGDQERLGRRGVLRAERGEQGAAQRGRQRVRGGQDRPEQLVQAGERQPRLGLHPGGLQHPQAGGPPPAAGWTSRSPAPPARRPRRPARAPGRPDRSACRARRPAREAPRLRRRRPTAARRRRASSRRPPRRPRSRSPPTRTRPGSAGR